MRKDVLLTSLDADAALSMAFEAVGEDSDNLANVISKWIEAERKISNGMVGTYSFPKNPDKFSNGFEATAFGYAAALLKKGLGDRENCADFKLKWTADDLLDYVTGIQEGLRDEG